MSTGFLDSSQLTAPRHKYTPSGQTVKSSTKIHIFRQLGVVSSMCADLKTDPRQPARTSRAVPLSAVTLCLGKTVASSGAVRGCALVHTGSGSVGISLVPQPAVLASHRFPSRQCWPLIGPPAGSAGQMMISQVSRLWRPGVLIVTNIWY